MKSAVALCLLVLAILSVTSNAKPHPGKVGHSEKAFSHRFQELLKKLVGQNQRKDEGNAQLRDECPDVTCQLFCEHGFEQDATGCDVCACATAPAECPLVTCLMTCDHGFARDENGCHICECAVVADEETVCGAGGLGAKLHEAVTVLLTELDFEEEGLHCPGPFDAIWYLVADSKFSMCLMSPRELAHGVACAWYYMEYSPVSHIFRTFMRALHHPVDAELDVPLPSQKTFGPFHSKQKMTEELVKAFAEMKKTLQKDDAAETSAQTHDTTDEGPEERLCGAGGLAGKIQAASRLNVSANVEDYGCPGEQDFIWYFMNETKLSMCLMPADFLAHAMECAQRYMTYSPVPRVFAIMQHALGMAEVTTREEGMPIDLTHEHEARKASYKDILDKVLKSAAPQQKSYFG